MNLRSYQIEAVDAIEEAWGSHRSALLVMATGTGKTVTFAHIANRVRHGRIMVIAHRQELIDQAAAKIKAVTGSAPEIEMADQRADSDMFRAGRIVVASKDTLHEKRLSRFKYDDFSTLIIDEAHHAVADSYRRIINHFTQNPKCKVLGVTATPDRLDEAALGKVFETCAYTYDILDGINDGFLVPINQRLVTVDSLEYSKLHTVAGDFNASELEQLMTYEEPLHKVADSVRTLARWKKTLVFAVSVAHGERLKEILNRGHGKIQAEFVCGTTPKVDRAGILARFKDGDFQFLVNVGVFTEGFDEPSIEMVAIARPTLSRSLYAQMIGRGTRPLPGLVDHLDTADARLDSIARSKKPCIAEGSLVLTNRGLCPIECVTLDMRVWDGVEFVTHSGPICRGEQDVIHYAGLIATPDHEVWTATGWKTLGQCAVEQTPICVAESGGQAVREAAHRFRGNDPSEQPCSDSDEVPGLRSRVPERLQQCHAGHGGMQEVRESAVVAAMAGQAMRAGEEPLLQSEVRSVSALREEGYPVWVRVAPSDGYVDSRESGLASGNGDRPDQQRRSLRTRQSSMDYPQGTVEQSERTPDYSSSSSLPCLASGSQVCRRNSREDAENNVARGDCGSVRQTVTQTKGRVWDILNAGPRHRFTVSGLLVSNCLEVLDFEGNAGRHKLVTVADVLGGNYDDEIIEKANKAAREAGMPMDMIEALAAAQRERHAERERERMHALAKRNALKGKAEFSTQSISPFDVLDLEPWRQRGWDNDEPASEKQTAFLEKAGVPTVGLTKRKASQIMSEVIHRRNTGLCTYKQAAILKKHGYEATATFEEAGRIITELKANGWKRMPVGGKA